MLRCLSARLVLTATFLQLILSPALAQTGPERGITFTVDSMASADLVTATLGQLAFRITFAGTRGRLDVLARAERPAIRIKWVTLAPSAIAPGDYYLFDGTALTLVRPARKEYSRFQLADASYNYQGRRDGWPTFPYDASGPEILAGGRRRAGWRGDFTVFWHGELMHDTSCTGFAYGRCTVRGLALGRLRVVEAPAEHAAVARWLGLSEALARIAGLDSLIGKPIHLTAVAQWAAPAHDRVTNLITVQYLSGLRAVTVDPALLTLPRGYRKTR